MSEWQLCHDCDLPTRVPHVPEGGRASCPRCSGVLLRRVPNSIDRTLAFASGGLVLFVIANLFPFLSLEMQGNVVQMTLATGVTSLIEQGRPLVGLLTLLTTILAPFLQLACMLYVVAPLKLGRRAPASVPVFRLLLWVQTWSMMEVFMLGMLVSLVKLAGMAEIVPGIAIWAFAALIPILAAATAALDPHLVWERIGAPA